MTTLPSVLGALRLPGWQRSVQQQQDDDSEDKTVIYNRVAMTSEDDHTLLANGKTQGQIPEVEAIADANTVITSSPNIDEQVNERSGTSLASASEAEPTDLPRSDAAQDTQGGDDNGGSSSNAPRVPVWHESYRALGLTPEDLLRDASTNSHGRVVQQRTTSSSSPNTTPLNSAAEPTEAIGKTGAEPPARSTLAEQQQPADSAEGAESDVSASIREALSTPMNISPRNGEDGQEDSNISRSSSLDGGDAAKRELVIYALPLYKDRLVFLPVSTWKDAPEPETQPKEGLQGMISKHVEGAQQQVADTWAHLKASEPGSLKNKIYKLGQRMLDDISPEERLMRKVPKEVDKIIIHHPTSVAPDDIMDSLQGMTKGYGLAAAGKATVAGLMLPIAMGVDLIILPGPQVLTYYALWEMYRNTHGSIGNQRLTKMVQQKDEASVRINFVPEPRLDKYAVLSYDGPDEVLREEEIELLCWELHEPDLLQPLLELRRRELRRLKGLASGKEGGKEGEGGSGSNSGSSGIVVPGLDKVTNSFTGLFKKLKIKKGGEAGAAGSEAASTPDAAAAAAAGTAAGSVDGKSGDGKGSARSSNGGEGAGGSARSSDAGGSSKEVAGAAAAVAGAAGAVAAGAAGAADASEAAAAVEESSDAAEPEPVAAASAAAQPDAAAGGAASADASEEGTSDSTTAVATAPAVAVPAAAN